MYAALFVALLSATSPGDSPSRWVPFEANPAWEVYGREDASGRFCYSQRRKRAPVVNFGVSLPPMTAASPTRQVSGHGSELASVYKAARGDNVCAHADCDRGRCDRKKDKDKEKATEWEFPKIEPFHIIGGVVGLVVSGLGLLVLIVLIVLCVKFALYLTTPREPEL